MSNDHSLLERIANGDREAVGLCTERYSGLVWSLARRFIANRADAEEAVQDVFMELWTNAKRFDAKRADRGENTPIRSARLGQFGWAVAAMLALFLVVTIRPDAGPEPLDPAAAGAAVIEQNDTSIVEWGSSEIPAYNSVQGDVVWNDEQQQGFLRLVGMPANDPAISQYQLWINDPERDANPVDGGVFDVPRGGGEVIIPIDAKLDVSNPNAFAVTREQPGGVVVSDGPLLIVAASS